MPLDPPTPTPTPGPEGSPRGELLARLCNHLGAREPFVLVTGEAGMGKTKLVRDAVARWGSRAAVAFVTNPAMTRTELIEEIIRRFGVTPPNDASKPQLLACLEQRLAEVVGHGQIPVIVVDDAHDLDDELLGELRLLTNTTVQADLSLTIVLSGHPLLETRLADPTFASLRQRVAAHCQVGPMTMQETRRYLQEIAGVAPGEASGPFARKACGEIFRRSGGAPPAIQALAEEAFRRAREAGVATVTSEHVQAAAAALGLAAAGQSAEESADPASDMDPREPTPPAPTTPSPPTPKFNTVAPQPPLTKPAVPIAESPVAHAKPARTPAPAPAPAPPPVERRVVDMRPAEERRREWVERFIGPDEPRFGSLLSVELRSTKADTSIVGSEGEPGLPKSAGAPAGPVVVARRRKSTNAHRPRPRLPFRRIMPRSWLIPAAVGVFVITGAFVLIAVPRHPVATEPIAVEQVIAGASSSARSPDGPSAPQSAAARGSTTQRHALDVGSYISSYRAEVERDRLVAETGLDGWVVADGDGTYHVVIGIYRSVDRADISASTLLSRGLVSEARVIPLPPRNKRR